MSSILNAFTTDPLAHTSYGEGLEVLTIVALLGLRILLVFLGLALSKLMAVLGLAG